MKNAEKNPEATLVKKERKTDRRSIYTRKVIMEAYIELIKIKPKEKIRITELCKLAEINRCTFYLHFEDVLEVEKAIEEDLFEKFKPYVETQKPEVRNRQSISDAFIDTMLHNDTYRTLMSKMNTPSLFTDSMYTFYLDKMKSSLPKGHHLSEREQELLYTFIVGGVTAVEQDWLKNDKNIRQENQFLNQMVQTLMNNRWKH